MNPYGLTLEDVGTSKDDYEKAVYLDNFVTEFEDFMMGSSDDASTSKHSDDLYKVDYRRALVFWDEIRPERIQEIKRSLEDTWDPDIETLKELGVSLWYEEGEESDIESETPEDERARYFAMFLEDLDAI
ncbi:hypothetical protein FPSE_10582 [Fusarium pseudograminearum CS3096]|uniref:Uncharacterized protein n=1 Tax=Fusarium pseudograminearum (strain CS3096) TaxID=1028729 RepID=K3V7R0_FUSPC|nr:hypothetical protein FPSE_10582 [Fusarium pseudograminearum CS3096]EKJ69244.1 hypothetical protein FPSE_10582 [Fusarium pseudograminearum CS3096]KAF0639455.1 hypothetical protein FPSE5266_10582 [Fusarium pseudograminearum]